MRRRDDPLPVPYTPGWLGHWLTTDEIELFNRSRGKAFLTEQEEDYLLAHDFLSDGRPGEQPITARYVIIQMPHQITVDFGHNKKVVIENWDGKVTADIYNGDELPEKHVELKVGE